MEGEAPTEMLRELQRTFGRLSAMSAAVTAAEGLRTKLDDWRSNYENASEVIAQANEAVAAYDALPEVKGFAGNLKAIQEAEKNWQRVVTRARAEMEKAVADQKEAERKAKQAERERLAAEQAKREIEEEVASVASIEVAITGDLDKFMPETAEVAFKARQARLKSAEAKAAAEVVAERIATFRQLKSFWLEAIKKGQFKAFGIVAADEQSITLKKKMTWQQFVSSQQNLAFRMIVASIVDDTGARSVRASDRAELAIGAHLFITKYFGQAAVEKSKSLRDAVEKLEALATGLPGTKAKFERLAAPSTSESAE
jgi:chromosome segregation ATPase